MLIVKRGVLAPVGEIGHNRNDHYYCYHYCYYYYYYYYYLRNDKTYPTFPGKNALALNSFHASDWASSDDTDCPVCPPCQFCHNWQTQQNKQTKSVILRSFLKLLTLLVLLFGKCWINLRQMVTYGRLRRQLVIAVTEQTTFTAEHAH